MAPVPLSVNRSISTLWAWMLNTLKWAARSIFSRCSLVVMHKGSTILILKGSMIVFI